jgi:hypothetical protein
VYSKALTDRSPLTESIERHISDLEYNQIINPCRTAANPPVKPNPFEYEIPAHNGEASTIAKNRTATKLLTAHFIAIPPTDAGCAPI